MDRNTQLVLGYLRTNNQGVRSINNTLLSILVVLMLILGTLVAVHRVTLFG